MRALGSALKFGIAITACLTFCDWVLPAALADVNQVNAYKCNEKGKLCHTQGRLDEAVGCYKDSIRWYPTSVGYKNLGHCYHDKHEFQQAKQSFLKAIQMDPSDAGNWYDLGVTLTAMKSYSQAESAYLKAITLGPNFMDAMINVGELYLADGKPKTARGFFLKAYPLAKRKEDLDMISDDLAKSDKAISANHSLEAGK